MKKLLTLFAVLALAACQSRTEKVPAIDLSDLDTTVSPKENFYLYANGGWMKKNPLSAEYARYGSFDKLGEDNVKRLNDLFSEMSTKKYKTGSVGQKISDLYKQGLDSVKLNADGAAPLKPHLDEIFSVKDKKELISLIAKLKKTNDGGFFDAGVMEDLMNSDMQILYLSQCGLGMGEKDYYVNPANAAKKAAYQKMLSRIMSLCGKENADEIAKKAVAVENRLAKVSWSMVQLRDIAAQYNPMSSKEFFEKYPAFDFKSIFEANGITEQEKLIVMQPDFFEGLCKIFESEDIEALKDYVACSYANGCTGALSDDFYETSFDFYSKTLRGITEKKPRWKRAMSVPNGILSEAVGKMYVEKYFPESHKKKVLDIVDNLRAALGEHIAALDWMTDSTKAYGQEKLAAITVKIGYPDKWKDYSTLAIDANKSYLDNMIAASEWYVADNLDKLGKPTDRTEWGMPPQMVNAYYNPTSNEICFPAAILQPPFFNADADDAVNYGAIGVVIGHEMTHGFDDQGRLFDKKGNMSGWWKEEDETTFKEKTKVLIKQYDEIEVLPGLKANGTLSLGENIADQGGVGLAYTAMQLSWKGKHPAPVDGFTAEQRFFLGFAHVWAGNITDEEKERRTKIDVHSLSVNRVNATLRNFQSFFDAFDVKPGDAMWRDEADRIMIW